MEEEILSIYLNPKHCKSVSILLYLGFSRTEKEKEISMFLLALFAQGMHGNSWS